MNDKQNHNPAGAGHEKMQQQLLQYLQGNLSNEDQYELEKKMANDDFTNDAVEGLQQINNQASIPTAVQKLNAELKHRIIKKKKRTDRKIPSQFWTYISILILLSLIIVAYFLLKL